jgi:hypothetical protein
MSSSEKRLRRSSSLKDSILATSCDVRKPSKKCRKGTREARVAAWATAAMSWASWTEFEARKAKPVWRQAITSEWSPKIERAWVARARAVTCIVKGVSSPAILYMLGIMRRRPCDAVKVVASAPACSAPCTAPAAPPSDCISAISGMTPQRLVFPLLAHSSHSSAMVELGVIGYIAIASLMRKATEAAASLPSTVIRFFSGICLYFPRSAGWRRAWAASVPLSPGHGLVAALPFMLFASREPRPVGGPRCPSPSGRR